MNLSYYFSRADDSPLRLINLSLECLWDSLFHCACCSPLFLCFGSRACVMVISPAGHCSILPSLNSQSLQAWAFIIAPFCSKIYSHSICCLLQLKWGKPCSYCFMRKKVSFSLIPSYLDVYPPPTPILTWT